MKVRLLRTSALEDLRSAIEVNLERYRSGSFKELAVDGAHSFEYPVEVDASAFTELRPPLGDELFEVENCYTVYTAMPSLSPYEARDERLWTFLSHTMLLDHARVRWPIPLENEAAVKHIAKHFFARDKRGIERDNVASRLWWMAYLCARIESLDLRTGLEALLFRSDVRANLVERPTTSQSEALFGAVLRKLCASLKEGKELFERTRFRSLMVGINSIGGASLIDCLTNDEADDLIVQIMERC